MGHVAAARHCDLHLHRQSPMAVATQIGSGAYTQATLTSAKLTISVPSGETNFSVAYLCPSPTAGPFINQEYINQASTLDGTSFSEICNPRAVQGGVATVQVDATAIPGAEGIFIGRMAARLVTPSVQVRNWLPEHGMFPST